MLTITMKVNTMAIRILLVDDQSIVRQGLRMFLSLDDALEIVGEAANGYEAITQVDALKPDVILMDLLMPQMNGVEATAQLRMQGNKVAIIALSQNQNPALIDAVIEAGANAYLPKEVQTEELITVIKNTILQ